MTITKLKGTSAEILVLEQLGRGGMGEVYDANWIAADGMVITCVLKTMPTLLSDRDRERFFKEGQIAAQLDHGNIVKVIMAGEIPGALGGRGTPYLLMLRVDGVDLRKLLREVGQRFNLLVSVFIVGEVLAALEYAHERTVRRRRAGVVHFDIKPPNIMISSSGEVKVTDFGIARFANSIEGTLSQAVGTLRYMSPEQFSGKGDEKSDIYSLGLVLFELLQGERPFPGVDDVTYQQLIMSGQIPELTQIDVWPWLAQLVRSMLDLDPKKRPSAADARSIILEKMAHYQLGSKRLAEMYAEFIGEKSSGLTGMLNLEGSGLEFKRFPVVAGTSSREGLGGFPDPVPLAAPDEPTVGEPAEQDSPSVFRRRTTPDVPAERTFTGRPPPLLHFEPEPEHGPSSVNLGADTNALVDAENDPPIDPTIRLPPIFDEDPPVTRQQWPSPLPLAEALDRPTDSPPAVDAAAPDSVPVLAAAQPQSQRKMAWFIGLAGSTIIILLAVVIGLVVKTLRSHELDQVAEPSLTVADPLKSVEAKSVEPTPVGPTPVEPAVPVDDLEVEPDKPTPIDIVPEVTQTKPEDEVTPDPVEVVEPKPATKSDKPKPVPQILVIFKVSGSPPKAQVKVGNRLLKNYNYAVKANLAPGKHVIHWRLEGESDWHSPGTLVVENIGSKHYDVLLGATQITANIKEGGTK